MVFLSESTELNCAYLPVLSQFTGDGKYVYAAGEATEYMFNNYWYPESGVLHWGGHGYVDLVTGNRYGMKGVCPRNRGCISLLGTAKSRGILTRGRDVDERLMGSKYEGLGCLTLQPTR